MECFYNENDPKAAAWLRNLIDANLIANGYVDERSIEQLAAKDVSRYKQCHFFAGIGGWSYALSIAGWPEDVPVWTGSCPCQPLSCAGQRAGEMDERHLWPAFYRLIAECRPATIFGEQVAGADGLEWLDGISLDLEEIGYAIAAADLPAACVGAPHQRNRLFWVAESQGIIKPRAAECRKHPGEIREARADASASIGRSSGADSIDRLADTEGCRQQRQSERNGESLAQCEAVEQRNDAGGLHGNSSGLAYTDESSEHGRTPSGQQPLCDERGGCHAALGDSASAGQQEQWREYRPGGEGCSGLVGFAMQAGVPEWNGPTIAVKCSDGSRRVSAEPGAFPLAHGLPARMGRLRGYGNAIVPQVAARFIQAYLETV